MDNLISQFVVGLGGIGAGAWAMYQKIKADNRNNHAADVTGAGNSTTDRICLMGHKDSMVLVEQIGIRSQTQYKQDYLATLFTSDTLYGVKAMRTAATTGAALSSSAFALAVPA